MLKILRNKKTAKRIWIGLAIIIIPAFALWGFGGSARDKEDSASAGKIFGKSISSLELKNSLAAVKSRALLQFGDRLPEIEQYLNFEGQAWERLMLLLEAKKRRINAKDKEVIEEIRSAPYFQDKNGLFSNKIYQEALRYVLRVQPRIFEEQTRQNLILAKLYKQVTKDLKLSDEQIRQEYLKANEELSIYYIGAVFADYAKTVKPTEEEISTYFEQNKAMFKVPPVEDQPARIPQLSEIKDGVKNSLIDKTAKEIAQTKINECAQKLKQLDFNQAAAACGLKSATTDFFKSNGTIENLGVARNFWQNARDLKDNATSQVIANDQGYYIIKLKALKPIDEKKFLEEKKSFSERLLSAKQNELFSNFIMELKKKAQ